MPVKTKEIVKMLESVEAQVNRFRTAITHVSSDSSQRLPKQSIFIDHLRLVGEKFDELSKEDISDYREMKLRIADIVEDFSRPKDPNELIEDLDDGQTIEDTVSVVFQKFVLALETLEKLECLPLKQRLTDCWDYVKEMGMANQIEDFQNIKELGTSMLELLGPLQRYKKSLTSELLSERITLYSSQLCRTFKLLIELVQEQHRLNAPIYNCKKYICDRLASCFKLIIELFDVPNPPPENELSERGSHFVYRMDVALDIISEISGAPQEKQASECDELWLRIEDVFSSAMEIAQVCKPYDFKAVTGACQSIASEYENLKLQLTGESSDTALNNLFTNTLNDALYRLERKVNVAVLNLVMEVFCDPFNALRKLVMNCGSSLNARKRSKNDLTNAIEDFDQIIDKTMQIGLFAISSCKDKNRTGEIQNCLAGLESLETELVSAIIAFYLRPDSKEMRANVKLLTAQWQLEVNKLRDTIDLIIDSAAYCEVVLNDVQERISVMTDSLDNRESVTQAQVQGVVQRALSLSRQISAIINDIGIDIVERQTVMMVRELKAAIFEADAASKNLLIENATEPQQLRVIKRCELILNVVKRLQPALVTIMNNTTLTNVNYEKSGRGQGDTAHDAVVKYSAMVHRPPSEKKTLTYIRTPYTVRNYKSPLSIQPANSVPRTQLDLSYLMPYIKRGREMRTERSIMYKTPRRSSPSNRSRSENKLKVRKLSSIRQHLFSRDSICSNRDAQPIDESMDLTAILENFTSAYLSANETSLDNYYEKVQNRSRASVPPNDKTVTSLTDSFAVENMQSRSDVLTADNANESSSTVGGGDAPGIIKARKDRNDPRRTLNNSDLDVAETQLFDV